MLHNLERTRAAVRNSISKASTISDEECQLTLTKDDFLVIQWKMDKIDQRLNELYKKWQAEYKDIVMSEECEEIRRFYKPYLENYKSKYRILYQILQQANRPVGQTSLLSTQEPTSGITPSLAALDDALALRRKEWKRGEPGKDMLRQYSTVNGHLMLTPPKHEDMRMDSTLDVTPEGSLSDLPAAVGGVEKAREGTHQVSEEKLQDGSPSTNAMTSTEETTETLLKLVPGRNLSQVESPRRIQRTREASREDAIASTRQFFASVNEQTRVTTMELPIETSADASGGNTMNLNIPVTSATPTVTEAKTRSPSTFLPNGSPSRPTTTTTCRPQMWVQHVLEGQINEPSQEGTGSAESSLSEPYVLAEGIPEELGQEWRVLHPFEIPGVRFPTDNTPPNQRRLAENDALVELIQTTE